MKDEIRHRPSCKSRLQVLFVVTSELSWDPTVTLSIHKRYIHLGVVCLVGLRRRPFLLVSPTIRIRYLPPHRPPRSPNNKYCCTS